MDTITKLRAGGGGAANTWKVGYAVPSLDDSPVSTPEGFLAPSRALPSLGRQHCQKTASFAISQQRLQT